MDASSFARLSGELRNRIYAEAFSGRVIISKDTLVQGIEPALTVVCRQMRQESLLLFYKHTPFLISVSNRFDYTSDHLTGRISLFHAPLPTTFLTRLAPDKASSITTLNLCVWNDRCPVLRSPAYLAWLQDQAAFQWLVRVLADRGVRPEAVEWIPMDAARKQSCLATRGAGVRTVSAWVEVAEDNQKDVELFLGFGEWFGGDERVREEKLGEMKEAKRRLRLGLSSG